MNENQKPTEQQFEVPDKSLVFAKSTSIAMFIVLLTLGAIFLILSFVK